MVNCPISLPISDEKVNQHPNCTSGAQEIGDFRGVAMESQQHAVLPEFRFGSTGNRRFSGSCHGIATARCPSRVSLREHRKSEIFGELPWNRNSTLSFSAELRLCSARSFSLSSRGLIERFTRLRFFSDFRGGYRGLSKSM